MVQSQRAYPASMGLSMRRTNLLLGCTQHKAPGSNWALRVNFSWLAPRA